MFKKFLLISLVGVLASPASASIYSGSVYCDANQSGTLDLDDTPLAGVEVLAVIPSEPAFDVSDTTNVAGDFSISDLILDTYESTLNAATLPDDAAIIGDPVHVFTLSVDQINSQRNWLIESAICQAPVCGDGILDEGEICDDGNNIDGDGCSATCTDEGVQGCTPGYWRQDHHFDSYPASYGPNTLFSDVFEDAFPGQTLSEVTWLRGGGLNALGRHVAAALLNAASGDVDFGLSVNEVVDAFNAVYPGSKSEYEALKDQFNDLNERGCPLN